MSSGAESQESGQEAPSTQELLVKQALHIGSRIKVKHMNKFIFKLRADGVYLIDIKKSVERLNVAARFIAMFPPEKVVVCSTHVYGVKAAAKFCELTSCVPAVGDFPAGLFTNRTLKNFMEPKLVFITDPRYDSQAVQEATVARIPVIAMCSTDNLISGLDLVLPLNNRGRTSLAYSFWYLARQVLFERGQLTPEREAQIIPDDFLTPQAAVEVK